MGNLGLQTRASGPLDLMHLFLLVHEQAYIRIKKHVFCADLEDVFFLTKKY